MSLKYEPASVPQMDAADVVKLAAEGDVVTATTAHSVRGTSLIRNNPPVGPYSRPMPRAL